MPNNPKINVIYSNHILQAPDGTPISRIGAERSQWYIDRGLAKVVRYFPFALNRRFPFIVRRNMPFTVRLKFEPAGRGHEGDLYYLSDKENKCVVCGAEEEINKHHIIPRLYRKHMPEEYKDRNSHDVVILCVGCHVKYEVEADSRKREIAKTLGFQASIQKLRDLPPEMVRQVQARKGAVALLRHRDRIPADRAEFLKGLVREFLGENPSDEALEGFASSTRYSMPNYMGDEMAKFVLDRVDLKEFGLGWRRHFMEVMNPQCLPVGWDADRSLSRES
jgi:hypothetical protein